MLMWWRTNGEKRATSSSRTSNPSSRSCCTAKSMYLVLKSTRALRTSPRAPIWSSTRACGAHGRGDPSQLPHRVGRDEGGRREARDRCGGDGADLVRNSQVDAGQRPGVTSEDAAEIKRLTAENAELRRAN